MFVKKLDVRKSKVLHFNFFTIFLSKCCNNFTLSIFNDFQATNYNLLRLRFLIHSSLLSPLQH